MLAAEVTKLLGCQCRLLCSDLSRDIRDCCNLRHAFGQFTDNVFALLCLIRLLWRCLRLRLTFFIGLDTLGTQGVLFGIERLYWLHGFLERKERVLDNVQLEFTLL